MHDPNLWLWGHMTSSLCLYMVLPLCVSLSVSKFTLLEGPQSYWFSDLSLSWWPLQRPNLQTRSHSEVIWVKTSNYLFGGAEQFNPQQKWYRHKGLKTQRGICLGINAEGAAFLSPGQQILEVSVTQTSGLNAEGVTPGQHHQHHRGAGEKSRLPGPIPDP